MDKKEILGVLGGLIFIFLLTFLFTPSFLPNINFLNINSFGQALWEFRALDVFLQLFLIVAGVFGFLTLIKNE